MRNRGIGPYIGRRVLALVPLLVTVSIVVFLLMSLVPGGPVAVLLGPHATDTETVNELRAKYRLDEPLYRQYLSWVRGVLHGDLGTSLITSQPVTLAIKERLPVTVVLNVGAILIALVVGISMGTVAAVRRGKVVDRVAVATSTVLSSAPSFVVAIVALYVFALKLGIFPLFGTGSGGTADWLRHLVLPAIVMATAPLAFVTKITRAAVLEELERDHVAFARARGISELRVIVRYGLRNALIPIITASGLLLISLLTGTVFVETVFGIPGVGGLLVSSIGDSDIPTIQGIVLMVALWIALSNIFIDLLYLVADPRVSFGKGRS